MRANDEILVLAAQSDLVASRNQTTVGRYVPSETLVGGRDWLWGKRGGRGGEGGLPWKVSGVGPWWWW